MINPFLERLKRQYVDKDDELRAAAAKVQETMASPGWRLLWDFITDAEQDALARLFAGHRGANGAVMEQADYARLVGYLSGLREPQGAAEAFELAVRRLEQQQ
jgi:hypothetical protein